jgi:hypothetical protein
LFLILDEQLTEFSQKLKAVAERKGFTTIFLTSAEIVSNSALVFSLSEQDASFQLRYQNTVIETKNIEGIYCGINTFDPILWNRFSSQDAEYAAQEMQALWVSILASFSSRVVNPPALDTLAGTLLSTPETLYLAHRLGFQIPMTITVESGKMAAELLSANVLARYADLGEVWINEIGLDQGDASRLAQKESHYRVREEISGKPACIALVGKQFFVCISDSEGVPQNATIYEIPEPIRSRLLALHKQLNLNLSEYYFHVTPDENWIFSGYGRPPTLAVTVYGDLLFEQIIHHCTGRRG